MSIGQLAAATRNDIFWMFAYSVVLAGALRLTVGNSSAQLRGEDA
jgi:hypothetical protein